MSGNSLGYGCSSGKPSERNLYADIAAALQELKTRFNVPESQVILYGQSIGTVPSVDLASATPGVAALILHSPLMCVCSAFASLRTLFDCLGADCELRAAAFGELGARALEYKLLKVVRNMQAIYLRICRCCDAFPSIEKIPHVRCPTLIVHGTEDEVIDFSHGLSLYESCPSSVEPLWVAGE